MALTFSPQKTELKLPAFQASTIFDEKLSVPNGLAPGVHVFMFICNHCPYVKAIEDRLLHLIQDLSSKPVQFVGVCSNDPVQAPGDSLEELQKKAKEKNFSFPYIYDPDQRVAKLFGAVCTPEFFVFNAEGLLSYRGRFDDNWKDPASVTKQELKEAIEIILSGGQPKTEMPAMGCSLKWQK